VLPAAADSANARLARTARLSERWGVGREEVVGLCRCVYFGYLIGRGFGFAIGIAFDFGDSRLDCRLRGLRRRRAERLVRLARALEGGFWVWSGRVAFLFVPPVRIRGRSVGRRIYDRKFASTSMIKKRSAKYLHEL
jgi:hypothetical protein